MGFGLICDARDADDWAPGSIGMLSAASLSGTRFEAVPPTPPVRRKVCQTRTGRRRSEGAGRSGAAAQAAAPTHHRAFEAWRPGQGTAHPTGVEDRFLRRHAAGPPIVAVGRRPGQPELGPIAGPVDLRRRGCVSECEHGFHPLPVSSRTDSFHEARRRPKPPSSIGGPLG